MTPAPADAPAEADERFRKIFEYSNDAIFLVDPERDEILDVNPKACAMLGFTRSELLALPVSAIHPTEMERLMTFAQSVSDQGCGWTNELTCMTRTARQLPVEMSASTVHIGDRHCLLAMVRDISERRRSEEKIRQLMDDLRRQANHDPLTGLPNRAVFYDRLEQAILNARRTSSGFCVGLLDLDRFKPVNDCFGHQCGDLVLIEAGARLQRALRQSDTVARLGGDEFGFLLPTVTRRSAAERIAAKLLRAFGRPFRVGSQTVNVGASLGLALSLDEGSDLHSLLEQADAAMYSAKRSGTGSLVTVAAGQPLVA